jgi:hypothetical protein
VNFTFFLYVYHLSLLLIHFAVCKARVRLPGGVDLSSSSPRPRPIWFPPSFVGNGYSALSKQPKLEAEQNEGMLFRRHVLDMTLI